MRQVFQMFYSNSMNKNGEVAAPNIKKKRVSFVLPSIFCNFTRFLGFSMYKGSLTFEFSKFEVNSNQALQLSMIEKQIKIIVCTINCETFLTLQECKTLSKLKDKSL